MALKVPAIRETAAGGKQALCMDCFSDHGVPLGVQTLNDFELDQYLPLQKPPQQLV